MNNGNFMNNNNLMMNNFNNLNNQNLNNNMNENMNNNDYNNYNNNNMMDNYLFQMQMNNFNNNANYNNNNMMNNINNNNMMFNNNYNNSNIMNNNNFINNNMNNNGINNNNNNQNNINMNFMNNNMTNNMNNMNNNMNNINMNNNMNQNMTNNNMNKNNMMNNNMNQNMMNNNMNQNMMGNNMNQNMMDNNMNQNMMNNNMNQNNMMNNNMNQNMINNNMNQNNMMNNNINNFQNYQNMPNNINNINNINNNNLNMINKNTEEQYKQLCEKIQKDSENKYSSVMKLLLNIIYYDENLKSEENYLNCSFFQLNIKGTFYGCHNFELFRTVCDKIKNNEKEFILISSGKAANKIFNYCYDIPEIREYYIYCNNIEEYQYLKGKYPKLIEIYNIFDKLVGHLISINAIRNDMIKSNNFIFFDDYNRIYIKFHFEIIRKYFIYKILKSQMNNDNLLQIIKCKYPYYLELAKQLKYRDQEEIINFLRKKTDESEENIKIAFNCCPNSDNYISLYTYESFYYKYLNKFLREGDSEFFRILSSHLAKFIFHLYDFREKNIQHHDTSILFRNMYINEDQFYKYLYSKNKVICFPSFTSTSLKEDAYKPIRNSPKDLYIKLIIEQNNCKSVISIGEKSKNPNEKEYLFLPFSFFKIIDVKEGHGIEQDPHRIFLIALNSEKSIENMIADFMIDETDNLDPEGLDMLVLSKEDTYISINPNLKT